MNKDLFNISSMINSYISNNTSITKSQGSIGDNAITLFRKGNKIHIKKKNRGKFTDYCGGKVTQECIQRGKNSSDPKIRRRATFAANARKWKHKNGGTLVPRNQFLFLH